MNVGGVKKAKCAAKMFVEACDKLLRDDPSKDDGDCFYGSKLSSAVKRASMELTRALTDMRKAN